MKWCSDPSSSSPIQHGCTIFVQDSTSLIPERKILACWALFLLFSLIHTWHFSTVPTCLHTPLHKNGLRADLHLDSSVRPTAHLTTVLLHSDILLCHSRTPHSTSSSLGTLSLAFSGCCGSGSVFFHSQGWWFNQNNKVHAGSMWNKDVNESTKGENVKMVWSHWITRWYQALWVHVDKTGH